MLLHCELKSYFKEQNERQKCSFEKKGLHVLRVVYDRLCRYIHGFLSDDASEMMQKY